MPFIYPNSPHAWVAVVSIWLKGRLETRGRAFWLRSFAQGLKHQEIKLKAYLSIQFPAYEYLIPTHKICTAIELDQLHHPIVIIHFKMISFLTNFLVFGGINLKILLRTVWESRHMCSVMSGPLLEKMSVLVRFESRTIIPSVVHIHVHDRRPRPKAKCSNSGGRGRGRHFGFLKSLKWALRQQECRLGRDNSS